MKYEDANDVKQKMKNILDTIDKSNKWYKEFKWFSKVNYTTTTEYYGELRLFLYKVLKDKNFMDYKNDLQELYDVLDQTLFPKKGNQ